MTKAQRHTHETLVRVRDFGAAHQERFPESSTGRQAFDQVAAAVAAVNTHLTQRDLARVESRKIKAATRAAVLNSMRTVVRTAREVTKGETVPSPFVLPAQRTAQALLSKARLFIDGMKAREALFASFGLPPAFVSEFTSLVNALESALDVKLNGRSLREKAQTGIEHALDAAKEALDRLDALVPNVLRDDPVGLGHWRGARKIEGLASASSSGTAPAKATPTPAETSPVPAAGETLPKAS